VGELQWNAGPPDHDRYRRHGSEDGDAGGADRDRRPLVARGDYGFPSEYVASLAALLVIAAWPWGSRQWRRAVFGFVVAAVVVAIVASSRVVLLLSYPSDVLAGLTAGAGWTVFVLVLFDPRTRVALADVFRSAPLSSDR